MKQLKLIDKKHIRLAFFKKINRTPIKVQGYISLCQVGQHPTYYLSAFDGIPAIRFGFDRRNSLGLYR